jgi:hypothetical protein
MSTLSGAPRFPIKRPGGYKLVMVLLFGQRRGPCEFFIISAVILGSRIRGVGVFNKGIFMSANVTVACRIPNGIILRIYEMVTAIEPSPMGGREIKQARQIGKDYRLKGATTPTPNSMQFNQLMHGYGITQGIPKDVWDKWLEQNKDSAMVQNKLVFAYEDSNQTFARAAKQRKEGVRSGLEPLDPFNLPKGITMRNLNVETADEMPPIPVQDDIDRSVLQDVDRTSPARNNQQRR